MRRVVERPSGAMFDKWSKRAREAREALIRDWKRAREAAECNGQPFSWMPDINESLYKELRQVFLFEAFYRKCAYCEAQASSNYPIQVEHYRPKASVTQGRKATNHPGYFWLAYEWWNLVPSCAYCNTDHTDPIRGRTHPGKKNEFPVGRERVHEPPDDPEEWQDSLSEEEALLLNPYFDDPEDHMDFEPKTGMAFPIDERGKATIEICDLNRPSLCEKRLELRTDSLVGMVSNMLFGRNLESVVPAEKEFTMWRKRLLQNKLLELCQQADMKVTFTFTRHS
jgi:hypothetical protein